MPPRRMLTDTSREVSFSEFMKTHPPAFIGGNDVTKASNWLRSMETCFRLLRCGPELKVDYAGYMLQEGAAEWWAGTRDVTFQGCEDIGWEEFKIEFKDKYMPRHLINELRDEFRHLAQGDLSVPDYATKFVRLEGHYPGLCEDEEERARKFVAGLDTSIRLQVMAARMTNLKEAVALADTLEKELKKNTTKKKAGEEVGVQNVVKKPKIGTGTQGPPPKPCVHCKKTHGNKPCYRLTGGCFRCGKPGHFARNCTIAGKPAGQATANTEEADTVRKVVSARAFAITETEEGGSHEVITGT